MLLFGAFIALIISCSADRPEDRIKWDGLRLTWGRNTSDPNVFVKYPRTEEEAKNEGFIMIADCDLTAKWRGRRYIKDNDYYVVLLFDVAGFIAGIQNTILKDLAATFSSPIPRPCSDDGDRWVISAYFTDPSRICTTGRTAEEFAQEGTGSNLYIQNGTVPELSTLIPARSEDADKTLWTRAKCFPLMGIHYYYDLRVDLSCNELFPVTILYNNGQLTAFAWVFTADIPHSGFEHLNNQVLRMFMDPVPTCVNQYEIISTQHVYLTENYRLDQC